ncbi:hypothetical protein BCR34DRAFT_588336 [Clohesyomyces aquaticus]|uniref:F-box domain-containing protein n=1 Tax=Clohesyomyces aquaticus TaxID=1231657 RepID=A0A1Y1ZKP6_9PLEO|nr:hypothetical protein BCR34DRAFT_588336 [Clohesyomyces aquaticus]
MLGRNLSRLRRSIHVRRGSQPVSANPLSVLPIDLMHIVFELLSSQESKSDLLNLALTCRALHALAQEYICKAIKVHPNSTNTTFTLFQRTIKENPGYGQNVISLTLAAGEPNVCDIPPRKLRKLLESLPRVRSLDLPGVPPEYIGRLLFSKPLDLLSGVTNMTIPGGLKVKNIVTLITLRIHRTWKFWNVDDSRLYHKFPKIAELDLTGLTFETSMVGFPLFENFMRRSQTLETLEMNIPLQLPMRDGDISGEKEMDVFSAAKLSPPFSYATDTLKKLYLYDDRQIWKTHDGTRLDLSAFSKLKDIEVSARLFFAPLAQGLPREGTYKLFPKTAETIKIWFPNDIGIFYSATGGIVNTAEFVVFNRTGGNASEVRWIQEFAIHKSFSFPHLKEIRLLEKISGSDGKLEFNERIWVPPYSFKTAFDATQIQLTVSLRREMPKD